MEHITAPVPMAKSIAKRTERLKKRPQYLRVAKGIRVAMPGFILQASRRSGVQGSGTQGSGAQGSPLEADTAPCRIGFTATKKVGNAVVRNRTKRRLRAAADALLPQYGRAGFDYVLVGRMTTQERKFDALCNDLQNALMRIHQEQKTVNKNR